MTIAGSDSGGAAGVQADLKTWAALGAYGMSAITAVTAQNSARVAAVHYLPPEFVAAQIDAVLGDYGAAAIKTGFLGRVEIVAVIAERLAYWAGGLPTRPTVVVDPVLVNHRGEAMFGPEVAAAYRELLIPLADLITPNRQEAALLLTKEEIERLGDWEIDAISQSPNLSISCRVLLKGLRRDDEIVDVYWDGQERLEIARPFIATSNTHGSGDTLSAAICAYRALGQDWPDAIRRAGDFTHAAIGRGANWRLGAGHGPLGHSQT